MKKNKCQAFTKEKRPCQNYVMNGSDFCYIHKGLFKNFPPVKITALKCPYCDETIKRGAKFCKFCKNSILLCRSCDEPLRKDAKSCSFCKEDLKPAKPKPYKLNYFGMLGGIGNWIAAKSRNIKHGFFWVVVSFLMALLASIFILDIFFRHFSY